MQDDLIKRLSQPIAMPALASMACSGVYFLYHEGQVVYVGQAVDMRRRIGQHLGEGSKVFDAVSYLEYPPSKLAAAERRFIDALLPKYNRCGLSTSLRAEIIAQSSEFMPGEVTGAAMNDEDAARFLGVELAALLQWQREGRIFKGRIARSRKRAFLITSLTAWARKNADLIAAVKVGGNRQQDSQHCRIEQR